MGMYSWVYTWIQVRVAGKPSITHSSISAGASILWSLSTRMLSSLRTGDSDNEGRGSSGRSVAIATASIANASVAIAAGSADPLVAGCRLRWPNSASERMVNLPILLAVAIVMTFLSLVSQELKVVVQLAPTSCGFHQTCAIWVHTRVQLWGGNQPLLWHYSEGCAIVCPFRQEYYSPESKHRQSCDSHPLHLKASFSQKPSTSSLYHIVVEHNTLPTQLGAIRIWCWDSNFLHHPSTARMHSSFATPYCCHWWSSADIVLHLGWCMIGMRHLNPWICCG